MLEFYEYFVPISITCYFQVVTDVRVSLIFGHQSKEFSQQTFRHPKWRRLLTKKSELKIDVNAFYSPKICRGIKWPLKIGDYSGRNKGWNREPNGVIRTKTTYQLNIPMSEKWCVNQLTFHLKTSKRPLWMPLGAPCELWIWISMGKDTAVEAVSSWKFKGFACSLHFSSYSKKVQLELKSNICQSGLEGESYPRNRYVSMFCQWDIH